jgi:PAS domain S-box-containing protein
MDRRPAPTLLAIAHEDRLVALSPDLLGAAGFDGYVKFVNPAWERQLGYTVEELTQTPYLEFIHPDDHEGTMAEIERLATGAPTIEYVCRLRRTDGEYRDYVWSAQASLEDDCFYIVGKDITERRRLEEELERRAHGLERANAELQDFVYVASHDLSEPLRMVSAYLELLRRRYDDALDEDARQFIGFAVDGAIRMQKLIDDLLLYSRVGHEDPACFPVDMTEVVPAVLRTLTGAIEEAGAEVVVGPLAVAHGDQSQITQLVQNVVANAVKFHRPDVAPLVRVRADIDEEGWHLTVADNGIGIAPDHRERVFKMFVRLHGREEYPGTGVGLAICRRIVERHGGRIWIESPPGGGCEMHVTLPEPS